MVINHLLNGMILQVVIVSGAIVSFLHLLSNSSSKNSHCNSFRAICPFLGFYLKTSLKGGLKEKF